MPACSFLPAVSSFVNANYCALCSNDLPTFSHRLNAHFIMQSWKFRVIFLSGKRKPKYSKKLLIVQAG